MPKITRTFTVDYEIYAVAKEKGIEMSKWAEEGLRQGIEEAEKEAALIRAKKLTPKMDRVLSFMSDDLIRRCCKSIKKDRKYIIGWKERIKNVTGVTVSPEEIERVFGDGNDKDGIGVSKVPQKAIVPKLQSEEKVSTGRKEKELRGLREADERKEKHD